MPAMTLPDSISNLVGSIYDCIPDPALWHDTLDRVRLACDGYLATLAVVDTGVKAARFSVSCGNAEVLTPLLTTYSNDMPFFTALPKMELDVPQTVDSLYELDGPTARDRWISSDMAQEWAIPNRLDDFIWVPVMKQPGRIGSLVIVTHKDRPQISRADLEFTSWLSPHVRRAVTIGDLFETERRKGEIFRDIIDTLAHPVLIVSTDMQIVFANLAAEKLLQSRDVLKSLRGQLSFAFPHAQRAITQAVETGQHHEFALGPTGINVPLANCAMPSVAHVMPLAQRDPSQRISQRASAAIFIASAGSAPLPAMDAIAALFGLTAAEKRVAAQVAAGKSRHDIAHASGVSDGTIKTQLAAIFDKTDTTDQRGLALLIRDLTPPTLQN